MTILDAHAGDNYIVASHPDEDGILQYRLNPINGVTVGRPSGNPDDPDSTYTYENVVKTEKLTVWRTLWMELDQMAAPTLPTSPGTTSDEFAFDEKDLVDINGNAIGWSLTQPTNEGSHFDLAVRPAKPDISLLTTKMEKACILVEEITDEKFSEWEIVSHPSVAFERNINWEYVHSNYPNIQCGRDISTLYHSNTFWILHAVGIYEDTIGRDYDDEVAYVMF